MAKPVDGVHRKKKRRKKKVSGRNNGPARQRYWAEHRLEEHKIKHLMRCNGMTRQEATRYWREAREGRVK